MQLSTTSSSSPFLQSDYDLLRQIVFHSSFSNQPLLIPSLSAKSETIQGAQQILKAVRDEVLAWKCPSQKDHEEQEEKMRRHVFWSLLVAHTASFQSQHYHPHLSWVVPVVAVALTTSPFSSSTVRFLHKIVSSFSPSTSAAPTTSSNNSLLQFEKKDSSSQQKQLISLAFSFLSSSLTSIDCVNINSQLDILKIASSIVKAVLSVWIPSRGIFIDRIKFCLLPSCCPSSASRLLHVPFVDRVDDENNNASSESEDEDDEDEDKEKEEGNTSSSSPFDCALVEGFQLPNSSLTLESRIVLRRLFSSRKLESASSSSPGGAIKVRVVCFSCSLLSSSSYSSSSSSSSSDDEEVSESDCDDDDDDENENDNNNQEENLALPLQAFCEKHSIRILCCQRVVSPELKYHLATSCSVATFDRLGITHFPSLQQSLKLNVPALHTFPVFLATKQEETNLPITSAFVCFDRGEEKEEYQERLWIRSATSSSSSSSSSPSLFTLLVQAPTMTLNQSKSSLKDLLSNCTNHIALHLAASSLADSSAGALVSFKDIISNKKKTKKSISSVSCFLLVSALLKEIREQVVNQADEESKISKDSIVSLLQVLDQIVSTFSRIQKEEAKWEEEEGEYYSDDSSSDEEDVDNNENLPPLVLPCERFQSLKDAICSGLELAATLLSIVCVV